MSALLEIAQQDRLVAHDRDDAFDDRGARARFERSQYAGTGERKREALGPTAGIRERRLREELLDHGSVRGLSMASGWRVPGRCRGPLLQEKASITELLLIT